MSETEKEEKEIYTFLVAEELRSVLSEQEMDTILMACAPLHRTGASVAEAMLEMAALHGDDAAHVANAVVFDFVRYLKDGRVACLVNAGAAVKVVDTSELVQKAAAGKHVYFQSISTRKHFGEWAGALEMTLFPPEDHDKNDLFEFYIGCMPPGGGTILTPSPEGSLFYITVGLPAEYMQSATALASEYQLRIAMEGAGVGVFGGDGLQIAVQWNPDKLSDTGEPAGTPEGMYITPLRGPGIHQVTSTSDSSAYAHNQEE
jgi:hypothetical protein